MKDQHCPYLRPQKINTFIGIGSRQREFLDDLLPGDGVDSAVGYHQEQEQVKQRNDEVFRLAQHHDLAVDDLYAAAENRPDIRLADGYHYTEEGYRMLGATVAEKLSGLL